MHGYHLVFIGMVVVEIIGLILALMLKNTKKESAKSKFYVYIIRECKLLPYFYFQGGLEMIKRPAWANSSVEMQEYYDYYWGIPVHDDQQLFEMLSLELFQAGLSWQIIWKRRTAFEQAFSNFAIEEVANFSEVKVKQLCEDASIIRNRRKIEAVVNNAQVVQQLNQAGQSFTDYIWHFVDNHPQRLIIGPNNELPSQTPASVAMAKQMRKDGFKFVGPTIIYSFMTAVGMVNARLE